LPLYKKFLEFAGIEPERLYLKWVSASEGTIFAEVVREFTQTLRALPPMKERLKPLVEHRAGH
jgi:coenzyme F420-reducing hydrogenase delta subunit